MRRVSAKIFGNEKYVEVVCALDAEGSAATAQVIAKRTGIDHPHARDVLVRLAEGGVATPLPLEDDAIEIGQPFHALAWVGEEHGEPAERDDAAGRGGGAQLGAESPPHPALGQLLQPWLADAVEPQLGRGAVAGALAESAQPPDVPVVLGFPPGFFNQVFDLAEPVDDQRAARCPSARP
ncbi:MAG: hypothetical protein ACRDST_16890 [Pseudonocardiaceae bacterium]